MNDLATHTSVRSVAPYRQSRGNGGDEVWIRDENSSSPTFLVFADDTEIYLIYSGEEKFSNSQPSCKLSLTDRLIWFWFNKCRIKRKWDTQRRNSERENGLTAAFFQVGL